MSYRVIRENGIVKIMMSETLSVNDIEKMKNELEIFEETTLVKLDLRNCSYIQSNVVSKIIDLKKELSRKNASLILTNVHEAVMQLMEISNLINFIDIEKDFSSYSVDELTDFFLDPENCDAASDYIAENYNDSLKQKMTELLYNTDPILKEYAILTVGKAFDRSLLTTIRENLDDDVGNVNKAAILALGWLHDEASKDKIYSFLKSPFIDVAEAAAATIALLSDENDAARLKEYLTDPDDRLKRITIRALSLINDDNSYIYLKDMLTNGTNEFIKTTIVKAISLYSYPETADILLGLLRDASLKVREEAAHALIRIKAKDKIGEILSIIQKENGWFAYYATKAVGGLCDNESCTNFLVNAYENASENVKIAIIQAVGNIGVDCSDFLFDLLGNEDADIRREALVSLSKLNKNRAVPAAKEVLLNDESPEVRLKAVEILTEEKPSGYRRFLEKICEKETSEKIKEKILNAIEKL
ncbi:HEAT repeat domain-containing protein [Flexistipes sp.]|uniref:HEAT repeat domain-containing protein n=1 Tax=Flexistipes sp. TaxID=3088135 RepID=UPI002E1F0730|nr:HEAT repeat domain-containing protein [Flexistipes sp.]